MIRFGLRESWGGNNLPAQDLGSCGHDGDGGRVESGSEPECFPFFVGGGGVGERGGFGSGGAFVEKGGIGDFHAGQLEDHGLIVEEGFETTLRDFGLVGGIRGVPARVFQDGSTEDRGGDGPVISEADQRAKGFVLGEDLFQVNKGTCFGAGGREFGGVRGGQTRGKSGLDKLLQGGEADRFEHLLFGCFVRAEVSG